MANTIETQARHELQELEGIVTACEKLGNIGPSLDPADMADYAYVAAYLTTELQRQFQLFHITIAQRVLPLVADIRTVNAG